MTARSLLLFVLYQSPIVPWAVGLLFAWMLECAFCVFVPWSVRRANLLQGVFVCVGTAFASLFAVALAVVVARALHRHGVVLPRLVLDRGYVGAPLLGPLMWLFVYDAGYYVFHRWEHASSWLWRVHRLHHSDVAMNATTYLRQHVAESFLQAAIVLAPMLLLLTMVRSMSWCLVAFVGSALQFAIHADVPLSYGRLSWLVVSPLQHRLHHDSNPAVSVSNFAGFFPVLDVVGGTYRRPVSGERVETGVFEGV